MAIAQAQTAPVPASPVPTPMPSPSASPSPKPWVVDGFVDASLSNLNGADSFTFVNGGPSRVFDSVKDRPTIQNIDLRLTKNGPLGGKLELSFGTDADVIAPYPIVPGRGYDVTQAYLSYTSGPFTFIGGKYVTLAGAEVIRSLDNLSFSRSYLFGFAIPFSHTGGRVTYAPNDKLSLIGGLNLGWDKIKKTNDNVTIEGGIALTPSKKFSFSAQTYNGVEQISNIPLSPISGNRILYDAVATLKPNDAWTFTFNYDNGSQRNAPIVDGAGNIVRATDTARWSGLAAYAAYQINPKLNVAGRLESFVDTGGYRTGLDQRLTDGTVTLGYAPSGPLLFRLEARGDASNRPAFAQANGTGHKGQISLALESIVKF